VNRYGEKARAHWRLFLPKRYAQIEDPDAFFTDLGEQIEMQIEVLEQALAGDDPPHESYMEKVGRLNMARLCAESDTLRELAFVDPEEGDDDDQGERSTRATVRRDGGGTRP
jgi:hypothetical protein